MAQSVWLVLREIVEGGDDYGSMSDDELDMATSPTRSIANPFDTRPTAKVVNPAKNAGAAGMAVKPKQDAPMSLSRSPSLPKGAADPGPGLYAQPAKAAPPLQKPKYPGSFVGQVYRPDGGQYRDKRVSWVDKQTGKWRGRNVTALEREPGLIWNGQDWVTHHEFDATRGKPRR